MNQHNLYVVLEDLKQDLEVDTKSILYVFFLSLFKFWYSSSVHCTINVFSLYHL